MASADLALAGEDVSSDESGAASAGRGALRTLLSRLTQMIVVVLVLVIGTAMIVRLMPGDPAQAILGLNATPDALRELRAELGLDRSLLKQASDQLWGILHLDLGVSISRDRPVVDILLEAFPVTVVLMVGGIAVALAVSIPLGLLPALRRAPRLNDAIGVIMVVLLAIPSFVIGIYALLIVAVNWRLAPAGGWGDGWPGNFRYAWLPSVVLAFMLIPLLTRAVQRSTIDVLDEEFIEAARARGLRRNAIVVRHVLPNILLPLITLVGYSASVLLGGAVIVESVFGVSGFGEVIMEAVSTRDYPVIVGVTLFSGIFVVVVNLLTDLLYTVVDPRTRTA
ncbi:peptide/nickel transport system permease protein [Streptosporangium becharense]|uniref:Peptide/nickel transport system permease protein n=1 Tax=Streptosporangium becharense TaxID=1816182 RepID=A0A7W9MDN6_9ACTN|nr:ABC transporter permease [Streptosporangium becharense]MBB2914050.1 peptide/nickel transport system permease protein [Streptosporangium becharense]MBB5817077.1 peptide/nickel transport system permease protein [Streptosporangium becharense]